MNKSDIVSALSARENLTEKQALDIVNLIFDGLAESLMKGQGIELRGFGSFSVRSYRTYTGRNPKTGKMIEVKPKRLPFFKVGKELKERINSGQ